MATFSEQEGCSDDDLIRFEQRVSIVDVDETYRIPIESSPPDEHHHPLLTDRIDDGKEVFAPLNERVFRGNTDVDSFVCTRFICIILSYLCIAYKWMMNMAALCLYGFFIAPGVLQVGWRYFSDKRIHRGIPYGNDPRNKLDLYLPEKIETPRPVVAFVSGGAWIIGYKAWGSLLALQLVEENVIVACIDYRNFPRGTISDMLDDISQGISFIYNNIADYGGDIEKLYLVGQSAGAHLGACTLLAQAVKEYEGIHMQYHDEELGRGDFSHSWTASKFRGYIGISGGYDLCKLADHFDNKGMSRPLFLRIMEGENSLRKYSPELCLQDLEDVSRFLPPVYLFHGTADESIPCSSSTSFVEALRSAGVHASVKLYEGMSHTDLFLQDPMRGGYNVLLEDILGVLNVDGERDISARLQRRLVPECFLRLAHKISPF
ncbi:hypothetical protein KP509_36G040600 [Ceratopteris richardii]|uniref:protein-S-isoprenylcysteine alpha-carbonyl methylesterase n=1 Tax=Ceratopteris richardii TaxID=49495 RepID=A0A8T2QCJ3_CERRI|nr:hypothetical protein KP509_36G040600 [Ceratopteris richardii]KAH7281316.1 hypothetical protein KP509_36G040600 [Ceratopteris richardii]